VHVADALPETGFVYRRLVHLVARPTGGFKVTQEVEGLRYRE
jgi:hypothetical protein